MATLITGLSTAYRGVFAAIAKAIYFVNNFDPVKLWDGVAAAMVSAGITGPAAAPTAPSAAAGNTTNGTHRLRYRYKNSKTAYISNPSPELAVTVSGGSGALTFTAGSNYLVSSDGKVDTVVFEMTPVNGQDFYVAKEVANTAGSAVVSMADSSLIQQFNVGASWGSAETFDLFQHDVPPTGAIIVAHKGRAFIGGDVAFEITTATWANASASVSGTGFSTLWAGRLIKASGDSVAYEISSATSTVITLAAVYAGTSGDKGATVFSKTPNRVYYSPLGFPESFYLSVFARDLLNNRADQLTALWSRRDALYVFGKYSSERLVFDADPSASTSTIIPIQGTRGAFQQRCIVEIDGRLLAWDRRGMYEVGDSPTHLSGAIDETLSELVDFAETDQFHAAFDPVDRLALFFFVAAGYDAPNYAAVLEVDTGRWGFFYFLQAITASAIVPTSDGQVRLMLGDENGYSWFFSISGSFDGVPPSTSPVVTASGTPTTTVISVTETLDTSPSLAGVMLYNPANSDARVIASNTASQITLASALTQAPVAGDALYLGPILWEYRTKWLPAPAPELRQRPFYLMITLYPGSATGTAKVFFYQDFSQTAVQITSTSVGPDGTTITASSTYVQVSLDGGGDGYVAVPCPADFTRALQARVYSDRPDGELRIRGLSFAQRKGSTFKPAMGE